MPVAIPFNSLGAGNGFPDCLQKVNVYNYDSWTTYSGFNKDSGGFPSAASIAESKLTAMKVYWNLWSIGFYSSNYSDWTGSGYTEDTYTLDYVDTSMAWPNRGEEDPPISVAEDNSDPTRKAPSGRVCQSASGQSYTVPNPLGIGYGSCYADIEGVLPKRLYDGSTDDETNFRGYGAGGAVFDIQSTGSSRANVRLLLSGYGNSASGRNKHEQAYVELNGVHLVCTARGDAHRQVEVVLDAANMTAGANSEPYSASIIVSVSITADSLEFYTYP